MCTIEAAEGERGSDWIKLVGTRSSHVLAASSRSLRGLTAYIGSVQGNDPECFAEWLEGQALSLGRQTAIAAAALVAMETGWTPSSVSAVLLALQVAGVVYLSSTIVGGSGTPYADLRASSHRVSLSEIGCELTDFGRALLDRIKQEDSQVTT